jgi:hypothetical protein
VTGPRRLSQAISEGDGISLIVAVASPEEARQAEADGQRRFSPTTTSTRSCCDQPADPDCGRFGGRRAHRAPG